MTQPDPTPRLDRFKSYEQACAEFRYQVPDRFNVAQELLRRHQNAVTRSALMDVKFAGVNTYTFGGLDYLSDKFAVALSAHGIGRGDRVALALSQSAAAAVSELAILKMGAVAVVIGTVHDSFTKVLADTRCVAIVIDEHLYNRFQLDIEQAAQPVFIAGQLQEKGDFKNFWAEIDRASSEFASVQLDPDSPAFIFPNHLPDHWEGSEPAHQSIVHSHGSVLMQLPAFEMVNEFSIPDDTVFWTPLDWSSPSVLLGTVIPAWWYGCAVVSTNRGLPAGWINALDECLVTHAVVSPMHLRFLLNAEPALGEALVRPLRRIICNTPPEPKLRRWCEEFTEKVSTLTGWAQVPGGIATCDTWYSTREGWNGRVAPGFKVKILDKHGRESLRGTLGRLIVSSETAVNPALLNSKGEIEARSSDINVGAMGLQSEDGQMWISGSLQ